jgi:hypothetical protein
MLRSRWIVGASLAALTLLLIAPRLVSAQDADANEVQRYTLTDAGLAKYSKATKNLASVEGGGLNACDDEDADGGSLDEIAAKIDAVPGAKAAIQSAGMTSREYVLFSMSLLQNGMAAWAASQPGGSLPPGVSKANVDFLKKHDAELKQLETFTKQQDCGDEEAEDENG